jgi:hypothetical protein
MFEKYPFGFKLFGDWNVQLRAMHTRHPLGCKLFGLRWLRLWDVLGRVLAMPARLSFNYGRGYAQSGNINDVGWLIYASHTKRLFPGRIVLLDGTIVKQWDTR